MTRGEDERVSDDDANRGWAEEGTSRIETSVSREENKTEEETNLRVSWRHSEGCSCDERRSLGKKIEQPMKSEQSEGTAKRATLNWQRRETLSCDSEEGYELLCN
jgi:hypothetical protein